MTLKECEQEIERLQKEIVLLRRQMAPRTVEHVHHHYHPPVAYPQTPIYSPSVTPTTRPAWEVTCGVGGSVGSAALSRVVVR